MPDETKIKQRKISQQESKQQTKQHNQIQCPKCSSNIIVKKGIRKNKLQVLQQVEILQMCLV